MPATTNELEEEVRELRELLKINTTALFSINNKCNIFERQINTIATSATNNKTIKYRIQELEDIDIREKTIRKQKRRVCTHFGVKFIWGFRPSSYPNNYLKNIRRG